MVIIVHWTLFNEIVQNLSTWGNKVPNYCFGTLYKFSDGSWADISSDNRWLDIWSHDLSVYYHFKKES